MPKTRVAAYIRVSSEEQADGYSIDAQRRAIDKWAADHNGQLVKVYTDDSSGRSLKRTAFAQMRQDAAQGLFDALVVHKWDRFARNRQDSLVVKSLLRQQYSIKVYSVTEGGQDDTDGAFGLLTEGFSELLAEWYSVNLSTEVSKALSEKHTQGFHLTRPPLGYDMVDKELIINEREAAAVRCCFELYATGKYSYQALTDALNTRGYRNKKGGMLQRDTIRTMLVNRVYLGQVSYTRVKYNSDGSRKRRIQPDWLPARHTPIIDTALFEAARAVRLKRERKRGKIDSHPHMLRDLVYCHACEFENRPADPLPTAWAHMHHRTDERIERRYYVCGRAMRGHGTCAQKAVHAIDIENTVTQTLTDALKPGKDWRQRAIEAIAARTGNQDVPKRLADLREQAARMDYSFYKGFINQERYTADRAPLQAEIDTLTPLVTVSAEIEYAADVLNDFQSHWSACADDTERQNELLGTILKRVYDRSQDELALEFTSDFQLLIDLQLKTEVSSNPNLRNFVGSEGT